MDGHNKSGNIHIHIVSNSLRKYDVERQGFMERTCDSRAGYKHHVSKDYLAHLKQSLMDICRREHLHQIRPSLLLQKRKSQTGNTMQDAEGKRNWMNVTDSSVQTG